MENKENLPLQEVKLREAFLICDRAEKDHIRTKARVIKALASIMDVSLPSVATDAELINIIIRTRIFIALTAQATYQNIQDDIPYWLIEGVGDYLNPDKETASNVLSSN